MPSAFLFISGKLEQDTRDAIAHQASAYLPFDPDATARLSPEEGAEHLWCWSSLPQGARGKWYHSARSSTTCVDGWVVEEAPMDHSIAQAMHQGFEHHFARTWDETEGSWCAIYRAPHATWAGTDRAGGQHMFWGVKDGLVAISNRAMLVSIALERGAKPRLDVEKLAWWFTTSMSMLTHDEVPWHHVRGLRPHHRLRCDRDGAVTLEVRQDAVPFESWDEARAAHLTRSSAWRRLPGLPAQLNLTGGKDSRALLSAMVATGDHEKLARVFIQAPPEHPDVVVAAQLCHRLGLRLHVEPIATMTATPLTEQIRRHMWRTEATLHAWDLKAMTTQDPRHIITGYYGELYRSHYSGKLRRGWVFGAYRFFGRSGAIDPYGVLSDALKTMLSARIKQWTLKTRAHGWPLEAFRDIWHREVRMNQWSTAALRAEHTAGSLIAPLLSARQIATYDTLPRFQRQIERTHLELMRAGPDWLCHHPFANDTWHPGLSPWLGSAPTPALHKEVSGGLLRQVAMWRAQKPEVRALLCSQEDDGFHDLFDPAGVKALLERVETDESEFWLKGVFALLGVRVVLQEGVQSRAELT